jgi:hypothetical protein
MSDNTQERGPRDRDRINVNESWEVQYWTKALGVDARRLEDAVSKVGVMAKDVKAYLGK